MTYKKSTKRSLLMSALALLLCFSMLVGTTFAWFTDNVTSGNNKIVAGNLDIELEHYKDGEWKTVSDASDLFEDTLWEPGHTQVVYLRLSNLGTLALKYELAINIVSETPGKNVAGEDLFLSDYIHMGVVENQQPSFENRDAAVAAVGNAGIISEGYEADGEMIAGVDPLYMAVVVYMPETVDNEANYRGDAIPTISLGINLVATQLQAENDSFGKDYDEGAKYVISSDEEMIFNGNAFDTTVVNYGTLDMTNVTINADQVGLQNFGNATLNGVTMNGGSTADYSNITRGVNAKTEYNEATINSYGGGIAAADGAEVVFNSGSVYVDTASTSGRYLFYAEGEGSVIAINGGNFSWDKNDNQTRAYIYAGEGTTVYVNGGTFGKASTRSGYTAGILGTGTVIITGGTFGFDPTNWLAPGFVAKKSDSASTWTVQPMATDSDSLEAAIAAGETVIALGEGVFIVPDVAQGKTLTIIGNGNSVIATQDDGSYEGCDYSLDGSTVTFKNIIINIDSTTYTGYARLNATYENCTINGTYTLYGDSAFTNCTFNVSGDVYNIWTWGATNATFTDCTFNSDGKAMLLYGTVNTNLTLNGCTFNDKGGLTDLKAAVEIGNDYNKTYTLTVNNTTVNGYEINDKGICTFTTLWANKNSMATDKLTVTVDGVQVYGSENTNTVYIDSAAGLFAFANDVNVNGKNYSGKTVVLTKDIDLENAVWTPIGQTGATQFKGIFDGNGYTIRNLYIDSSAQTGGHYSSGLFGWAESGATIMNVKVDGATVIGNHNVAVIVGYMYSGKISNCSVTNANIVGNHANDDACGDKVGLIAGYAADETRITNCSASNSTVKGGRDAGQLIGCGYNVSVSDCTATNVTVSATGNCPDEKNVNQALIGRVLDSTWPIY